MSTPNEPKHASTAPELDLEAMFSDALGRGIDTDGSAATITSTPSAAPAQPAPTTPPAAQTPATPPRNTKAPASAPTITPTLTTGFENFDADETITKLNLASINTLAGLLSKCTLLLNTAENIMDATNGLLTDNSINIGIVIPAISATTEEIFNDSVGRILGAVDQFKITLRSSTGIDSMLRQNITKNCTKIIQLVTSVKVAFIERLHAINITKAPSATTTPTPVVTPIIVAPVTTTAAASPTIDTNLNDLNNAWSEVESFMQDDGISYTEKLIELKVFIRRINGGEFGDVKKEPVATKLKDAEGLLNACLAVQNEFNGTSIIKSQDYYIDEANRIKDSILACKKIEDFAALEKEARDLVANFDSRAATSKKGKIDEWITNPKTDKSSLKTRTIDLAKYPLTLSVVYGHTSKQVTGALSPNFLQAQRTRVGELKKAEEKLDKAKESIEEYTLAITKAISDIDAEIVGNIPASPTPAQWKQHIKDYFSPTIVRLQSIIDNKITEISEKVNTANDISKAQAHAIEKFKDVKEKIEAFNRSYHYGNDGPIGLSARKIWNGAYVHVEGVMRDSKLVKFSRPPFIPKVNIKAQLFDVNSRPLSSPSTPPGSASPYGAMAGVAAHIPVRPLGWGWKRYTTAFVVAAVATFIMGAVLEPKNGDRESGGNKDGIGDKNPKATTDGTVAAGEVTRKLEQATENMQRAARTLQETAAGNAAYIPRAPSTTEARANRIKQLGTMSGDQVLQEVERIGGKGLKTHKGVNLINKDIAEGTAKSQNPGAVELLTTYLDKGDITRLKIIAHILEEASRKKTNDRVETIKYIPDNISIANSVADLVAWLIGKDNKGEKFVIYQPINASTGKITSQRVLFRDDFTQDTQSMMAKAFRENLIADTKSGGYVAASGVATITERDMDNILKNLENEGLGGQLNTIFEAVKNNRLNEAVTKKIELFKL